MEGGVHPVLEQDYWQERRGSQLNSALILSR